jgi:Predicted ATPase
VAYEKDADTSVYEEYFDDWTQREADKKSLIEMVGHALVPDANERFKKFLMLTGDADNGKSVFFRCVKQLLNGPGGAEQNVSNVKLSKMATQRFSNNSVYGNMANVAGEVDGKKIRNTAALKDITGGDAVEIEPKRKDSFFDTINATMMFAANDPPILGERDKAAIASRIVPVNLPYAFVNNPSGNDPFEKQRRPESELEDELLTDEALSGLLRLAVDGVQRLAENNDVSLPESPMQRLRQYERRADPMRQFGHKCLTNKDGDYVVKRTSRRSTKSGRHPKVTNWDQTSIGRCIKHSVE